MPYCPGFCPFSNQTLLFLLPELICEYQNELCLIYKCRPFFRWSLASWLSDGMVLSSSVLLFKIKQTDSPRPALHQALTPTPPSSPNVSFNHCLTYICPKQVSSSYHAWNLNISNDFAMNCESLRKKSKKSNKFNAVCVIMKIDL